MKKPTKKSVNVTEALQNENSEKVNRAIYAAIAKIEAQRFSLLFTLVERVNKISGETIANIEALRTSLLFTVNSFDPSERKSIKPKKKKKARKG